MRLVEATLANLKWQKKKEVELLTASSKRSHLQRTFRSILFPGRKGRDIFQLQQQRTERGCLLSIATGHPPLTDHVIS